MAERRRRQWEERALDYDFINNTWGGLARKLRSEQHAPYRRRRIGMYLITFHADLSCR